MKIVVIGGAGYIGSLIVELLLARGHQVRVYDRLLFGDQAMVSFREHPNFAMTIGDIRDLASIVPLVKDTDAVILTAAIVGEQACDADPAETEAVNLFAPLAIAKACKYYGVNRFVFASTDSVYGIQEGVITEQAELKAVSLYARLKILMEEELRALSTADFQPVILRKATVYGLSHRMRFDLILNILARFAALQNRINIFGGEQWRPMVHARDAALAYVLAVEADAAKVAGQVFNVGDTSQNYQIGTLGELVRKIVPDVEIVTTPEPPDLRDYHVNCDKIKSVLGYQIEHTCEGGIREVYGAVKRGDFGDTSDAMYYNA